MAARLSNSDENGVNDHGELFLSCEGILVWHCLVTHSNPCWSRIARQLCLIDASDMQRNCWIQKKTDMRMELLTPLFQGPFARDTQRRYQRPREPSAWMAARIPPFSGIVDFSDTQPRYESPKCDDSYQDGGRPSNASLRLPNA